MQGSAGLELMVLADRQTEQPRRATHAQPMSRTAPFEHPGKRQQFSRDDEAGEKFCVTGMSQSKVGQLGGAEPPDLVMLRGHPID